MHSLYLFAGTQLVDSVDDGTLHLLQLFADARLLPDSLLECLGLTPDNFKLLFEVLDLGGFCLDGLQPILKAFILHGLRPDNFKPLFEALGLGDFHVDS